MHSAPLKSLLPIFSTATLLLLAPAILHAQQQTALVPDLYPAMPSVPAVIPAPQPAATRPSLIVIGFAGGFIRRTSTFHGEIALAHDLSKKYGDRIQSEIFENHHGEEAHREILRLLAASPIVSVRRNPAPSHPLRSLLGSLRSCSRSPPAPARRHCRSAPRRRRRSPQAPAGRLHHPRQRRPGHQLLPDRRPPPRPPCHLRRRPCLYTNPRQHPPHLQGQPRHTLRLLLVHPYLHQAPHPDRKRPPRLEPGRSHDHRQTTSRITSPLPLFFARHLSAAKNPRICFCSCLFFVCHSAPERICLCCCLISLIALSRGFTLVSTAG